MAVEAVIFDVTQTMVDQGTAQPGVGETLARLETMGVTTIAASNHSTAVVNGLLRQAGLRLDQVFTKDDVKANKPSPKWIQHICNATGLQPSELLYVGDRRDDMVTAVQGRVVYVQALWAAPSLGYGFDAPHPKWIATVVEHIFRKQHPWYWTASGTDLFGRPVRAMSVYFGGGDRSQNPRRALLDFLKDGRDSAVGPLTMKEFTMLHLLASLLGSNLIEGVELWTAAPGRGGAPNALMAAFLDLAAKLFRQKFLGDLVDRHRPAKHSRDAWSSGGRVGAIRNQLDTLRVNPAYRRRIKGSRILVVDDFLTRGYSTEICRNLLLAAGAQEVLIATIGKFPGALHVVSWSGTSWDPFSTTPPPSNQFIVRESEGEVQELARTEFVQSFQRIVAERW